MNVVNHIIFAVCGLALVIWAGMLGYKVDQETAQASKRLVAAQYN